MLFCNSYQLTNLDVSNNTALKFLSCYINQLTHLDVSKNVSLVYLDCFINQLTNLDVSHNTELTILDGGVNQIFHVVQQTGINNILQEKTIAARLQNGILHVSGLTAGKSWNVYNVSGKLVSQSIANSENADIPLFDSGVYLVQSGGKTVKIVAK